jgi:RimJ/RimL family protein N-acetyltransferase
VAVFYRTLDLYLTPSTLTVVTENKVAIHIYEKYQFIPYGTLKRGMKNRDGSYWDLLHMVRDLEG